MEISKMRRLVLLKPGSKLHILAAILMVVVLSTAAVAAETYNDVVITDTQLWQNRDITVTGTLKIQNGGSLTLRQSSLTFDANVDDIEVMQLTGNASITIDNSTIKNPESKYILFNLWDNSSMSYLNSSCSTNTSTRPHDLSRVTVDNTVIGELFVLDNVSLSLKNGADAYIGVFVAGTSTSYFTKGELSTGSFSSNVKVDRDFYVNTSDTSQAHLTAKDSNVNFQLDIEDNATVYVADTQDLTFSMYFNNISKTLDSPVAQGTTSSGTLDFSKEGGSKFVYTNTKLLTFNVYIGGTSNIVINGNAEITEPQMSDNATLTLGQQVKLYSNMTETTGNSKFILNGTTLVKNSDNGTEHPIFKLMGNSRVQFNNVNAIDGTIVYIMDNASAEFNGGTGWLSSMIYNTLTVAKYGTGSGTLTSSPAGITCGSTCSSPFTSGTSVTLTATCDSGSTVASWSGCATSSGNTCTVSMNAVKNVTATFAVSDDSAASNEISYFYGLYSTLFGAKSGGVTTSTASDGHYYVQWFTNGAALVAWTDGYMYSYYNGQIYGFGIAWNSTLAKAVAWIKYLTSQYSSYFGTLYGGIIKGTTTSGTYYYQLFTNGTGLLAGSDGTMYYYNGGRWVSMGLNWR
ncbi:MAG: hypothetical protein L7F77_11095 [Candidatus Magnetominusculus sp. LBB02]|nr:hypothetical protein [Candidatus Magnetominusculus sp. LBB02]